MNNATAYKRSFTHYQQKHNWDCGLSCVLMVLDQDQRLNALEHMQEICEEENFGKSTWTIDLCYLLHRFKIRFIYTTITLGVDPGYSTQGFYNRILNKDTDRVNKRFTDAAENGLDIQERSCDIGEITEHLRLNGPCIVLTNANVFSSSSSFLCGGGSAGGGSKIGCWSSRHCVRAYQGHYILVVGFDLQRKVIIYRNPSLKDEESEMSFGCFEEARTSYGTDEDVIFVFSKTP